MSEAKPVSSPLDLNVKLTFEVKTILYNPTEYRALVEGLQYLLLTRLDIVFAVNKLSQFMYRPTTLQLLTLKRLLHYLKGTAELVIPLYIGSPFTFHAFSNVDWTC